MDLTALSKERVETELEKALLKADKPSVFFEILRKMNQLDYWFRELADIIDVPQNPQFHAEGDVWTHTMMVLDQAAKYRHKAENPQGFMLAALCHDYGKAVCTQVVDGRIRSIGHETEGLPLVGTFLSRITSETKLINYVLNLCALHMKPNALAAMNAGVKSTNKMFDQAQDPTALVYMAMADNYGRIMANGITPHEEFLFERLEIYNDIMSKPFVQGRDLIEAGFEPNEKFSDYLDYAHKLRLAGVDKDNVLKQTLVYARKKK
jgi:tRNA nucleotidyltransferase (CCA-adding enzyme)